MCAWHVLLLKELLCLVLAIHAKKRAMQYPVLKILTMQVYNILMPTKYVSDIISSNSIIIVIVTTCTHIMSLQLLMVLIAGIIVYYTSVQFNIWWVLHVSFIFLSIAFPYRTRALRISKKLTYIHVACILVGLFLPVIPVIAVMSHNAVEVKSGAMLQGRLGFGLIAFPPYLCLGIDADVTFYSIILPNIILIQIGVTMLILTIWYVHKVRSI